MEMHEDPDRAPSDGANMINLRDAKEILTNLRQLDTLVKNL
jgi:2-dehydro-3-deoxyphosphooctonate aldolase (KDO 8-P synthase)